MPSLSKREQVRTEELFEFPITGPFGGVQSELPLTEIESLGFADSTNILFRRGTATVRPGYTALASLGEPVLAIADFYNKAANHIQTVITPTRLLQWTGTSFTQITGIAFTGSTSQTFAWDVLGNKLCFSQGADIIWYWDGITGSYSQTSASAPAANYLAEIGLHLMTLNTIESGTQFTQRYHWSGAGDPTDWTSFSSGINDNLNNLGPGTGLLKLGQYGYGWHINGIVQIQPTGIGTNPFYFVPIINSSLGNISGRSLDHFNQNGIEQAAFVGEDNVYVFNQSSLVPIGDRPIDGQGRRGGARSRIFTDIFASNPANIYGFVTTSINGTPFNAYWLNIPGIRTWVYNFDESNWTPFSYDRTFTSIGNFYKASAPRIMDLIGTIAQQTWTPANLAPMNPFIGFCLGGQDGTVGYVDFTNYSETSWNITSGKHTFGDRRHKHTVKKFRLVVQDNGQVTFNLTLTNEIGYTITQSITIGNGSGDVLSRVVEFNISGLRIQWQVSGSAGSSASFVEFCPIFDVSGEQRGGSADNN